MNEKPVSELVEWLKQRREWLDREIKHGGDAAHLSARYAECSYILAHANLCSSDRETSHQ